MKRLAIFVFLFPLIVFGQTKSVKTSIYFGNNKFKLGTQGKFTLDSVVSSLPMIDVYLISVKGNTDNAADSLYNLKLSAKRTEEIKSYLLSKGFNEAIIKTNNFGEEKPIATNDNDDGKQKNRRVDLVFVYRIKTQQRLVSIDSLIKPAAVVDTCSEDTVLISESGTMIRMNRCYYLKIKDCFTYKEYLTATSIQQSGLRTVDEKGNPIESGGMIDIRFCADSCLKIPVIIFLPVPECISQERMTLWTITQNNTWRNSKNKIDIVKVNGKLYYKMKIFCPGKLNCDRPKDIKGKVKVKLNKALKVESASLSYNCPLYSVNASLKRKQRVAVFPYNCPGSEPVLYLKAVNKNGDTLVIDNKEINQYTRKQKLRGGCSCGTKPKEKFLGVFRVRQKYLYKKYKLHTKDFNLITENK